MSQSWLLRLRLPVWGLSVLKPLTRGRGRRRLLPGARNLLLGSHRGGGRKARLEFSFCSTKKRTARSIKLGRAVLTWACSSAGTAPPGHGGGQGFESPQLHFSSRRCSRLEEEIR